MVGLYEKKPFVEAHTDEWFEIRKGHFTSSEWNKLFLSGKSKLEFFGKGALTYIDEKVSERTTGKAKEISRGIPAIDHGIYYEPYAAKAYEFITGQECLYSGFYEYSPVFGGTPDREISSNKIIEIKCPHVSSNFIAVCSINSGEEYKKFDQEKYAQCQGNMLCTNTEVCDMFYFDPRQGFQGYDKDGEELFDVYSQGKIIPIYRDEAFIREGLERLDVATDIMMQRLHDFIRMQEYNRSLNTLLKA